MAAETAFIGFGEAGSAVASGWGRPATEEMIAYDLKIHGDEADAILQAGAETGVAIAETPAEALAEARHVLCLVTADQAVAAARSAAPHLASGAIWYDGNSCAPDSKREAAALIEGAGGTYVDMAIMAPIHPGLHRTALLIAGPAEALPFLDEMGMNYRYRGAEIGSASAVKMIRSVMVKGIEALSAECFIAAERAGVLDDVLDSLQASAPPSDWRERAEYNLERMMQHGLRRAAEMREVTATVAALGLDGSMAGATADWQQRIGDLELRGLDGDVRERLVMIEEALCSSAISGT
ncbi:NAD(P)-dependent oxidoreductase [Paracoccus sp. M683]|uniref:NAD(P)-dependent oxidoreductase n=1 Tax=Paracoccus sp. M683 TaxID=2594268 RepID=UPI00117C8F03|nr:DUF1932 domain-containing protein [Paracoccus sp. M683]TRW96507.1 NAD(P)-dependent oxidoreductase [Paracoccus sp. M683]